MKVTIFTAVLLVVLRLAIGWHLFYEGVWKEQHKDSWSSKGYLRNAKGPGALPARWLADDPDVSRDGWHFEEKAPPPPPDLTAELLSRFTVPPIPPAEQEQPGLWHKYLPPPVNEEWDSYFDRFVKHYQLRDPENRVAFCQAECIFLKDKAETVKWLREGVTKVPKKGGPSSTIDVPLKTPKRVQDYLDKVKEVHNLQGTEKEKIGEGVKEKLDKAVAAEKTQRSELLADLNAQTEKMKDDLRDVLTYEQKRMPPVPNAEVKPKEASPEWSRLALVNQTVRWGLLVVGLCLLLGLLTRPACLVAIVFLMAFYLAAPPPPFGPEDPQAKEHFYLINWNLIECVALLTLATTRSGRWLGLDGLLRFLLPWRRRSAAGSVYIRQPHSDVLTAVPASRLNGPVAAVPTPTRRD
jgi:uncharacterized membrane protein YphA (DoxX/SURF4 family)